MTIKENLAAALASLKTWKFWKELIMMVAGLIVGASAVYYFLVPSKIILGTASGLALVLSELPVLCALKVSTWVLILNVVLVLLAIVLVGKEFGLKSIIASLLLGPAMDLCELVYPYTKFLTPEQLADPSVYGGVMGDPWFDLCCFVLLLSASQAFLFRINASTGGLDIVAMIMNKYLHVDIGTSVTIAGLVVCCTGFAIHPFRMVVIGIIGTWLNGVAVDYFTASLNKRKRVCILTSEHERVREFIINELVRGCTLYETVGGYTGEKGYEIQALLTQHEYGKVMEFIEKNHIHAFMTAGNCSEVHGLWFQHATQKQLHKK